MPMYEYKCQSCGTIFELIQRFSDAPLEKHEECGGKVERLISASAFQFKGSGWYITDYAKGANASKKKGSEESSTGTDSKDSSSKPESTPAAPTTPSSSSSTESSKKQ